VSQKLRLWLRLEVAGRRWLIWLVLVFIALVAVEIGIALLPHDVLNTWLQYEEKSNGIREPPPRGLPAGLLSSPVELEIDDSEPLVNSVRSA
jgi:hypothetical protein